MRVALVKPDWRIRGGFELVVDRVEVDLRSAGHQVDRVELDVPGLAHCAFGVTVDDAVWSRAPEWFSHLAMLDRFRSMDLKEFDLVVSTQPPSYAVRHPRHLALFYHHARAFYDLEDVWVRAGRAHAALHRTAAAMLRAAEADDLAQVTHFLAGSPRVAERLHRYQGPDVPLSLYLAPPPQVAPVVDRSAEHVLVVSRHEFTKRTELAVQALALGTVPGVLVGDGGRLPFVQALAARIAAGEVDAHDLDDAALWLNLGVVSGTVPDAALDQVTFAGRVSDDELHGLYASALCVVAPAYDEDYGLTVLESMAHGTPVIVCRDGGGLTAVVEDGVNGLVVDPLATSIAAAVARLDSDRGLARALGEAGRETAAQHSAASAREELLRAVEMVMAGSLA